MSEQLNQYEESVTVNIEQSQFAKAFTYKRLLKLVLPSIIMMVFTSIYGVVDGIFVSNFVGETAFAAVNLIIPALSIFSSVGFMIGAGGTALVSKMLGEGKKKEANGIFSFLVLVTIILGVIITTIGEVFMPTFARLLGANDAMMDMCITYGRVCAAGATFYMLQNFFQGFFPTAEKAKLGLFFIIAAGLTNVALDALFMAGFNWGIVGAAVATVIGQVVGGFAPIIYFLVKRNGVLYIGKPLFDFKALLNTCTNGSSELLTNVSLSVVNMLYNLQLMKLVGESGVSAYGVLMYVNFIFCAAFIGYSVGISPIIGYNYGAGNKHELHNLLKKSLILIAITSVVMFGLSMGLAYPMAHLFVGGSGEVFNLTVRAFFICSAMFLVLGFNIFGSAFFTALNNGLVSAILSFVRTLILQVVCIFVLPLILGVDGIWASNVVAELIAIAVTITFLTCYRKKYGY